MRSKERADQRSVVGVSRRSAIFKQVAYWTHPVIASLDHPLYGKP
jgi:hypothetical protein